MESRKTVGDLIGLPDIESKTPRIDARLTKFNKFLSANNLTLGDLKVYDGVDLKLLLKKAGFKNVVDRNFVKAYVLQLTIDKDITVEDTIFHIRNGNYFVPLFPEAAANYYEREEALRTAENYLEGVINKSDFSYVRKDNKFKLLGTSGMKGIGKSELLKQIGTKFTKINNTKINPTYVTFNGYGVQKLQFMEDFDNNNKNYLSSFGRILLTNCRIPMKYASKLNIDQALIEYRLLSKMNEDDVLLVLVDEIGHLDSPHAKNLLSSLMSYMDINLGKVIFIFAHIMEDFLTSVATGSGRPVIPLSLSPLKIDIWKINNVLNEASKKFPSFHQLLLSCSGHPRSLFDSIQLAIKQVDDLLTNPSPISIGIARNIIIQNSKFNDMNDKVIGDAVKKWFSRSYSDDDKTIWNYQGLLHIMKSSNAEDVSFLFPLLIQSWSHRQLENPIAQQLKCLYSADALIKDHSEKYMEEIMFRYEAVIRLAIGEDAPFILKDFYRSDHIDYILGQTQVKLKSRPDSVVFLDDFSDTKLILRFLEEGAIVVSKEHNQEGIEYLAPFINVNSTSLMIACVQCKFVKSKVNWKDISIHLEEGMKKLKKSFGDAILFPVIYTTVDQYIITNNVVLKNAVYFTEKDLFNFTNRLGILRLHTEKLGSKLQKEYPILKSASSDHLHNNNIS